MDLEEYWGIGPKTKATLVDSLGTADAVAAIEAGDLRTLVRAGVDRGRATRILRRARSEEGIERLATRDTRAVYDAVLDMIAEYALTDGAAARIQTLTPLADQEAMRDRVTAIETARATWQGLPTPTREAVESAFQTYDTAGDDRAAVTAALELHQAGATDGPFEPIGELDPDLLESAASALGAFDGDRITAGVDTRLDALRAQREMVQSMAAEPAAVVEELDTSGVRDTASFREGLVRHLRTEADVDPVRIRAAMPQEAMSAAGFVDDTLTSLNESLTTAITEREQTVRADLESDIDAARETIDYTRRMLDTIARDISLARFAAAFDLVAPTYRDHSAVAVRDARNLSLAATGASVQPVSYAVGTHSVESLPAGDQVSVLTGANSGGKTTLLETLCSVVVLAYMGLPVPAAEAEVGAFDRLVFHRRHASFNAGVLESTLKSVVPPLAQTGRTLMLVDEFEAITEPGRAADLLSGLVRLTVDSGAVGTFVTHLADDLQPLPDAARIDGIVAAGLRDDLTLEVDYQPQFGDLGRSTPEFIVSRLVADADDRAQRAAFETLADALGTEVIQRTLTDARWEARSQGP